LDDKIGRLIGQFLQDRRQIFVGRLCWQTTSANFIDRLTFCLPVMKSCRLLCSSSPLCWNAQHVKYLVHVLFMLATNPATERPRLCVSWYVSMPTTIRPFTYHTSTAPANHPVEYYTSAENGQLYLWYGENSKKFSVDRSPKINFDYSINLEQFSGQSERN